VKKFLIVLGAAFLVILVIWFVVGFVQDAVLLKEGKDYADGALIAVAGQWSEKALLDRASPEFKQKTTIDELDRYFRGFSQLGAFQHSDLMQGRVVTYDDWVHGKKVIGEFTTKAQFENGEATIKLSVIKHGSHWQILGFNLQAPVFHTKRTPNQSMKPTAPFRYNSGVFAIDPAVAYLFLVRCSNALRTKALGGAYTPCIDGDLECRVRSAAVPPILETRREDATATFS
jgi:hypothetical protein